jgi:peptide/nickel transport system substrate-binding protein
MLTIRLAGSLAGGVMMGYSRRNFLRDTVLVSGGGLLASGCTSKSKPTGRGTGAGGSGSLPPVEGAQLLTDPAAIPKTFAESPEFAALVKQGKLPPVAERVGKAPLVLKPLQSVGKYGGQIRRGFVGVGDFQNAVRFCAGPDNLLYWDSKLEKVVPNLAAGFELSDNETVLTLHLRDGMKWSDGQPFTVDDIMFWRQDVNLDPDLGVSGSTSLVIGGKPVRVEKLDALTVRYVSVVPYPVLPRLMAGWSDLSGMSSNAHLGGGGGYLPKHYLSRFLPKYAASQAAANKVAKDAGFNGWAEYFKNRAGWHLNPELPTLAPWRVTRPINTPPWEFEANPYSIWVDNEGNQLPYIGKISMSNVENLDVLGLRAASGVYDFQDRHLGVTNLPVLAENEKRGNYTLHRAPSREMDCGIKLNLAYDADRELGDLLRNVEFRRALSMGIDRQQINEAFYIGTSTPSATMCADDSEYFPGAEWRTKWATHDVDHANALLDRAGLTGKDGDGYRLRRDGKRRIRLDFQATTGFADFPGVGEMVKRQWQAIGIDLNVQPVQANLLTGRALANTLMLSAHQVGTDDPFLRPDGFLPTVTNNYSGMIGIPYAKWFASGGKAGVEPTESVQLLKTVMEMYRKGLSAKDTERIRLGQELYKMHANQVWSIGIVGFGISIYGVYVASNKLRNVPVRVVNTQLMKTPSNTHPMTFYYE